MFVFIKISKMAKRVKKAVGRFNAELTDIE